MALKRSGSCSKIGGMARFKKRILQRAGVYHSPDKELVVNSENLQRWANSVQSFKEKGFDIPVQWGHPDDLQSAKPIKRKGTRRLKPKENAGWLTDFKVLDDGQGAEITVEIPDADDAKKVKNNLVEVSPVIWEKLKDGEGEVHENAIGACDLVLHPVDNSQGEFEPVEESAVPCSIRMSLEGDEEAAIYRMAAEDSDDEEMPADPPEPENNTFDSQGDQLNQAIELLAKQNVVLSDDTDSSNFIDHLIQALLTMNAIEGGDDEMGDQIEDTKPEVAALSLEQQEALDQGQRAHKFAEKQFRMSLEDRAKAAVETGRCTPAHLEARQDELGAVRLSLDEEGNPNKSRFEVWLEAIESNPQGTHWTDEEKVARMSAEDTKHPGVVTGEQVDDAEADSIADGILGSVQ